MEHVFDYPYYLYFFASAPQPSYQAIDVQFIAHVTNLAQTVFIL